MPADTGCAGGVCQFWGKVTRRGIGGRAVTEGEKGDEP